MSTSFAQRSCKCFSVRGAERDGNAVCDVGSTRLATPDAKAAIANFDLKMPLGDLFMQAAVRQTRTRRAFATARFGER